MNSITKSWAYDKHTVIALVLVLLVYPLAYCSGIMGRIIEPILTDGSRLHWWLFWLTNLAFHLIPFFYVARTLARAGESWQTIGLDWHWFVRKRFWILGLIVLLVIASVLLPHAYYGGSLPVISGTVFMAPVSTAERLFVIAAAAVVAITEEALFRGFAITRLQNAMSSVTLAVLLPSLSFIFIHGTPDSWMAGLNYLMAALAFSIPFVLLKFKRLERLIMIHFLIDASLVLAP